MKLSAKIIIASVLAALLAISCTAALAVTAEESGIVAEPIVSTDIKSTTAEESVPAAIEAVEETDTLEVGIFAADVLNVSASDHVYMEEKLLLVTVGNNSDTEAYSINATATYYGTDGEILGSETQSFDQLGVGFSWNFIFRPGYDFVDYKLEVSETVYDGELWKTYITDTKLINYYGNLSVGFYNNRDKVMIATKFRIVVFDENGEIIDILHKDALIGAAANSERSNGLPVGHCPDECAVAGCTQGDHIASWREITVGSTFITHEVVFPDTHPCYDEWMSYATLPGNVFASNLE